MDLLLLTIRLVLFAIFALAGTGKLFDLEGSKKAVEEFGVPKGFSRAASIILPLVELSIAALLVPTQTSWIGAIGGAALLALFTGGMLWQMWQGNAPDCHCFGQIHSEPVSKKTLLRNGAFVLLTLVLVSTGQANQGLDIFDRSNDVSEMNVMQILLGLAVLGFLAAIVYFLKKISEQQSQIMRRIEVLELISHDGGKEIERDDVNAPAGGLPIGAPVPEFDLPNLKGETIAFDHIIPRNKHSLLFFVSPTCNPCESMIPEFQEWTEEFGEKINFVYITAGKAKENLAKFGEGGFENMFVQEKNEISDLLETEWTPTALFINSDRMIASRPAAGDSAIRELVEKVRKMELEDEPVYVSNGHTSKLGESAPDFSLLDLDGGEVSKEIFVDKKTLVAYWSTGCPHCVNMLEELREWNNAKGADDPHLLLISSGEAEEHKDMGLTSPIVLDNDHEVAGEFGLAGTPSAVLVDKKGKIVSETAVGSAQIWTLLGKRK